MGARGIHEEDAVIVFLLILSLLANGVLGVLLTRAARRLLEFDSIWEQAMPVLFNYSEDLRKMLSLDLLTDNPEVVAFHKRNVRALIELDEVTKSVRAAAPPRSIQPLPRPDVE